ncbi:MAG TPA: TonB-dependent receptor [Chitinophagaceae bacterium]|nr:TonB-dependent receptor [Chitinophagaceae bacterium]
MKKLLLLFLCVAAIQRGLGQNKTISGQVLDSSTSQPLIGASIGIAGARGGTTTSDQGRFSLQVPGNTKEITVSMTGYQPLSINLPATGELSIRLIPARKELDDVVVVGYSTQRRKDITGAVATISGKDVAERRSTQLSQSLQGSISGVSVTRSGSSPGAGSSILIRGVTTLNTNSPLIIVDGVPNNSIDNVNADDVASVTVLKDASAAIYGSRAAAGVILITTKRGSNGKGSFEYSYEYGMNRPLAQPSYVDAPTYMRLFNERATNDGASSGPYAQAFIDHFADSARANPDKFPFANTDWQKAILVHSFAPRQQHSLIYTAGSEQVKTKVSIGYTNEGALFDNRNYKRLLFRMNNDIKINSKLNSNVDVSYVRSENISPVGFPGGNAIYESRIMPNIYQAYYSNGQLSTGKDGRNPVAQIYAGGSDKFTDNQLTGRLALNFLPLKGLRLTGLFSPTLVFSKEKNFARKILFNNANGTAGTVTNRANTDLNEYRNESVNLTGQFIAEYTHSFNNVHNLNVLGLFEELYYSGENLNAARSGFSLTDFPYLNVGSQQLWSNGGNAYNLSIRSFMGTLNYNYNGKYYVQGILRNDNSSRFAPAFRKANFPSVSVGWVLSAEPWMKGLNWLSFFKLRASYGKLGNERTVDANGNASYYPSQALISFSNALFYQNGSIVSLTGGNQQVYAVNNITWETTQTQNIGFDGSFLNNRLTASGDYFYKKTNDILLLLDIPLNLGYGKPQQNAGSLGIHGWEFTVNWKDRVGKLGYNIGFNLSDAVSKVIDMRGTRIIGDQSTFAGSEFNEWYGYKTTGIYQTAAAAAGTPRTAATVTAGDLGYNDINKDGTINANDRVLLGGSLPRYLYGGNLHLDYKNFDLAFIWQGVAKKLSRLNADVVQPFAEAFGNVSTEIYNNYWGLSKTAEQNLNAKYPRLTSTASGNNYALSDFWLINGAYFRVKNITLGYTLRQSLLQKAGVQSIRVYLAANDIFSVSHFPRYIDPESGNAGYPIMANYLLGASIKF